MKKLLLGLGSVAVVVAPIATVVACSPIGTKKHMTPTTGTGQTSSNNNGQAPVTWTPPYKPSSTTYANLVKDTVAYKPGLTANKANVEKLFKAFPNVEKQDLMLMFISQYVQAYGTTFHDHAHDNGLTPPFSDVIATGGSSRKIKFVSAGIAYPGVELTLGNGKKFVIQSFYEFDNKECKIPLYMYDDKSISPTGNIENVQPR